MATISVTLTVGATSGTSTLTAGDTRAVAFLDDLVNIEYVGQGLTRAQAGKRYLDTVLAQIKAKAAELEHRRNLAAVAAGTDLGSIA